MPGFAWSGWQLHQDGARRLAIAQLRDDAVMAARKALAAEQKQLTDRLASPPVQAALVAGDLAAASRELAKGWAGASDAAGAAAGPQRGSTRRCPREATAAWA